MENKILKQIIGMTLLVIMSLRSHAQAVIKGFEYGEVANIVTVYQQIPSLSFNMQFNYSDSARQDTVLEQIAAQYKIQNGKFWAMIDSTELVQGSHYNISVFHRDSIITVANTQAAPDIMRLPFLDSLFRVQNIDSVSITNTNDSTRALKMRFRSASPYRNLTLIYDPNSYLIKSIMYFINIPGGGAMNTDGGTGVLKIYFSGYSTQIIDDNYFREDKFIYKQGNQFYGQSPYNNFQIMSNATN